MSGYPTYVRSAPGPHVCPDAHPSVPHYLRQSEMDSALWYCPLERDAALAKAHREREEAEEGDRNVAKLRLSIMVGIAAEEDWEGPSIKPGTLTEEQIDWLASWLAGEGVTYKESETR